jgi:hypothetical protein
MLALCSSWRDRPPELRSLPSATVDCIASILQHQLDDDLPGVDLAALGQIGISCSPAKIAAVVKKIRGLL